jgi:uncharacterized protein YigA (DUF484 family)
LSDVLRFEDHASARDEAIRAFLKSRPDFLKNDPDLLAAVGLRVDAANIVDFGPAALSRAARAHRKETSVRQRLEAVARANFDAQAQTHQAVIALIGATDHLDLAQTLDELARHRFGLVAGVIGLEGPEAVPHGWRPLAPGQVDLTLGEGRPARLGALPTAVGLFAERAAAVGSAALIRLQLFTPERTGVLAFGAPDGATFSTAMGHELIDFLARVVERTAERWPIA